MSAAVQYTAADVETVRSFARRKAAARSAANRERWLAACRDFEAVRAMLVAKYHPRRIYQWGSLLDEGRTFTEISDIDVGLEGEFAPAQWFAMLADVEALTRFPLDVVDLGRIEPEFAEIIRMKGRVVYER